MSFSSFVLGLKNKKSLILTHAGADIDAVSAAVSLSQIFKTKLNAEIGIPDHINKSAKLLCEKFSIQYKINPSLQDFDALIFVDFNDLHMLGSLEASVKTFLQKKPAFLIDHHSRKKNFLSQKNVFSQPGAISTCELVYKLAKDSNTKVDKKSALFISLGLYVDSAGFLVAGKNTFGIMQEMLSVSGKSFSDLVELVDLKQDISERIAALKAAQRLKFYKLGEFLLCTTHVGAFEGEIATKLVSFGADLVFVADFDKKTLRISARASNHFIHENSFDLPKDVFEKLAQDFKGFFGGHSGAAGFSCTISSEDQVHSALQKCVDLTLESIRKNFPETEIKELH